MLEKVVSSLLDRVLQDYIKDLPASSIQTDLWKGHLKLSSLSLNPDTFNRKHLANVPFRLRFGSIRNLELQWKSSFIFGQDEPIRLTADRVFLLLTPEPEGSKVYNFSSSQQKIARLKRLSKTITSEAESSASTSKSSKGGGFLQRVSSSLLSSLIIHIHQFHIRYEDDGISHPSTRFSCGLKLDSIVITNRGEDERWGKPFSSSNTESATFKHVKLQQLSGYWDPHVHHSSFEYSDHHFVLQPLDATVRFQRDRSSKSTASVILDVGVNNIELALRDRQLRDCLCLSEFMERRRFAVLLMKRARHLRMHHFRFRRPIRRGESARRVWKFIRAALMGPSYFRRTGAYITWRRKTRLRYMNLWMRHRATVLGVASKPQSSVVGEPSSERVVLYSEDEFRFQQAQQRLYPLSSAETQRLKEYDETLPIEDLILFRCLAERKLKWMERISTWSLGKENEGKEDEEEEEETPGWFASWFSSPSSSSSSSSQSSPHLNDRDMRVVYEEMSKAMSSKKGLSDSDDETSLIRFTLKTGSVTLASSAESTSRSSSPSILSARFDAFNVDVTTSNNSRLSSIVTTLHEVEVHDRMCDPRSMFRKILSRRDSSDTSDIFSLKYDTTTSPSKASLRINAVDVAYLPDCVARFKRFLLAVESTRHNVSHTTTSSYRHSSRKMIALYSVVENAARRKLNELRSRTAQQLRSLSNSSSALSSVSIALDVFIQSPRIIVPENPCDVTTVVLVVDLGAMEIRGTPPESKDVVTDVVPLRAIGTTIPTTKAMEILDQQLYESRTLRVSSVQIMLGTSSEVLRSSRKKRGTFYVLRPIDASLTLRTLRDAGEGSHLCRAKLDGKCEKIHVRITSTQYRQLLSLSRTFLTTKSRSLKDKIIVTKTMSPPSSPVYRKEEWILVDSESKTTSANRERTKSEAHLETSDEAIARLVRSVTEASLMLPGEKGRSSTPNSADYGGTTAGETEYSDFESVTSRDYDAEDDDNASVSSFRPIGRRRGVGSRRRVSTGNSSRRRRGRTRGGSTPTQQLEATLPLRRLLETDLCVTSLEIVLGAQTSEIHNSDNNSNEFFTSPRKGGSQNTNSVTEIVCLSLNDLHLKSMFRPFDTEATLTLGQLQLRDRTTSHPQAKYMIRSGSSDTAMIDLTIRNTSERSPMWQSVRSKVTLNLGDDVEISVNQSTIVLLASAFATSKTPSAAATTNYEDDEDEESPPPFRLDESTTSTTTRQHKPSSSKNKVPDKLRVEATLKALVLRLYEPQRRGWLAVARLGPSSLHLTQNIKTRALGTLGNLTVRDVRRNEEVFGLRQASSKSLVSFSLLQNEEHGQRLDVTLESVKWMVKPAFTNAALKYLSKGPVSQYISSSRPNTPAGSPKKNKKKMKRRFIEREEEEREKSKSMSWTFTAKSPLVVMPCEGGKSRSLILDLGEIRYENSENRSNLRVLDANMRTNTGQVVISHTRCELDRRVVLRPYLHEMKEFDMPRWQFHVTEDSYDILRRVWKDNLSNIGVSDCIDEQQQSSPSDTFLSPSESKSNNIKSPLLISSPLHVSVASPVVPSSSIVDDELNKSIPVRWIVRLQDVSAILTRTSGDQLAIFRAQDFVMSSYYDDGGILERTFVTLHSVELKDTRPESRDVFRHSFVRSNEISSETQQPLISIRYVRRHRSEMQQQHGIKSHPVENDLIQDGTIHRPTGFKMFKSSVIPELWTIRAERCVLLPSALLALVRFFERGRGSSYAAVKDEEQRKSPSTGSSTSSLLKKVEILIDISEPELWFLEDTSRASSSAIVLSSDRVRCRHYEWNDEEKRSHQILDAFKCQVQVRNASHLLAVEGGFFDSSNKKKSSLIVVEPFHLFTEKVQSKMYVRCSHMRDVFGRSHFQYGPSIQSSFSLRELGVAASIASSVSRLGNLFDSSSSSTATTSTTTTTTSTELDVRVDSVCVILIHEVQTQKIPIATLHFGESVRFVNKEGLPIEEEEMKEEMNDQEEEEDEEDNRYAQTKTSLTLRLVVSNTKMSAQCRVPVSIFSYNSDLVEFEPVLEPYFFQVDCVLPTTSTVTTNVDDQDEDRTCRVRFVATRVLNLNITEHLLANISRLGTTSSTTTSSTNATRTERVSTPSPSTSVRKTYSLYEIHNELVGPKCRVRHGGSFKGVWSSGEHRPLQLSRGPAAMMRSPVIVSSSSSSSRRTGRSGSQDTIDLELYYADDGVTLEGLRDVNINQLGAQYHVVSYGSLSQRDSKEDENKDDENDSKKTSFGSLVTEVVSNINGGFKLLRVCSTATLRNQTNMRLEIVLTPLPKFCSHLPVRFRKPYKVTLDEGSSSPVPIHLAQLASTLKVRPKSSYSFVSVSIPAGSGGGDDDEPLYRACAFRSNESDEVAMYCLAHVRGDRCARRGTPRHVRVISFHSPLVIHNRLPCQLEYRMFEHHDEDDGDDVRGVLLTGGVASRHDLPSIRPWLSVRVPGFAWSDAVRMRVEDDRNMMVELRDEFGEILSLNVHLTRLLCGTARVVLYVPYWIVNRTFRPLLIRHDPIHARSEKDRSIAPGQASTRRLLEEMKQAVSKADRTKNKVDSASTQNRDRIPPCSRLLSETRRHGPCLGLLDLLPPASKRIVREPLLLGTENRKTFRINFRAADSEWSEPLDLDKVGVTRQIAVKEMSTGRTLLFGISVQMGPGHFHRTRSVVVMPRFVVVNNLERTIQVKQFGVVDRHALTLRSGGGRSSLHWVVGGRTESTRRRIRVRVDEFGWVWSGTVELHSEEDGSSSSTALRLVNTNTHSFRIVRVETIVDESSPAIVVRIRPQALSGPPYRIENLSLQRIRFRQCVMTKATESDSGEILLPYHVRPYAWDEPTSEKTLRISIDTEGTPLLGIFAPDKIQEDVTICGLRVKTVTDGPTRVLRIEDNIDHTNRFVNVSRTNWILGGEVSPTSALTSSSSTTTTQSNEMTRRRELIRMSSSNRIRLDVQFQIRAVGISVVDSTPMELAYATIVGLNVRVKSNPEMMRTNWHVSVSRVQIDNQLFTTPYPVLLRSNHGSHESDDSSTNLVNTTSSSSTFLDLRIEQDHRYVGLQFFESVVVRMDPVEINIDGTLLPLLLRMIARTRVDEESNLILDNETTSKNNIVNIRRRVRAHTDARTSLLLVPTAITSSSSTSNHNDDEHMLHDHDEDEEEDEKEGKRKDNEFDESRKEYYFKSVEIAPVRVCVSFVSAQSSDLPEDTPGANYMTIVLSAMMKTIANVENVMLSTRSVHLDHTLATPRTIGHKVYRQYRRDFFLQAYKIVGAADILGNPVEAVRRVGRGVTDLISYPAKGLASGNVRDMSLGLLRGTVSLFRNLIFVLTDVVSKITLGATRGLDPIIMYVDEYTSFRPRDGLLQGIAKGISEAVTTPIRSVSDRGLVRGLVPGLFAGLLGLFLKPLGGALYTSGATCLGIQQFVSPEALGKRLLQRERPPRYFAGPHAALRPYRRSESEGEEYLSRVDDGRYRSDEYVLHVSLPRDMIVLLTQRRLILIHGARARFCRKSWVVCLGDIVRVEESQQQMMSSNSGSRLSLYHFPQTEFNQGLSSPFDLQDDENSISAQKSGLGFVFVRRNMWFETSDQMKLLVDALRKFEVDCV